VEKDWLRMSSSGSRNFAVFDANESCKKRQKTFEKRQPQLFVGKNFARHLHFSRIQIGAVLVCNHVNART
jgi:hypothetical protein